MRDVTWDVTPDVTPDVMRDVTPDSRGERRGVGRREGVAAMGGGGPAGRVGLRFRKRIRAQLGASVRVVSPSRQSESSVRVVEEAENRRQHRLHLALDPLADQVVAGRRGGDAERERERHEMRREGAMIIPRHPLLFLSG